MQCQNKSVSAKRCIFHSNSACTNGGGERLLLSSWNRGLSGRLQFQGKGQRFTVHKGKEKDNTKKATEESSEIRYSLLPSFISAAKKQKQQPLCPKGSLSITDSFQKAFYIPSSLSDGLIRFSLVLLPFNYQKLSWERRVRCGSTASLPAGSWWAAEEYVPLHGDALLACSLSPSPSLAMAATAAAAACAGPLCAAGAGKRHRGEIRCHADLSASLGDFELTSGGCHVWQLEKQADCAWLLQEVPDLTLLPLLKCSYSFSLPPSPLVASSAIKAQVAPSCKKMPF